MIKGTKSPFWPINNWLSIWIEYWVWLSMFFEFKWYRKSDFFKYCSFYFIYDEYAEIVWNIFMYFMRVRLHISIEYENLALSF